MWRYNSEKRNKYYDEVIRLYTQEGLGSSKISRIIPVGRTTITSWIRNFADENEAQVVMKRKSSINADSPMTSVESTDVKVLQAEIDCLDTSIMIVETLVLSDSVLHPHYPTMRLEAIRRF